MKTIPADHPSHSSVRYGGLALSALLLAACACLTSCGKEEPAKAPPAAAAKEEAAPPPAAEAPKVAPAPAAPAPVEKPAPAVASPPAAVTGPTDQELAQRVAAFKAFHPYATGALLLKDPQFASRLSDLLDAIQKDPNLSSQVKESKTVWSGSVLISRNNITGPIRLDLKVLNYSRPFSDKLLAAVLSGDPQRFVNFVLHQSSAGAEFIISPAPSAAPPK